jgi:hypothetical protein
MVALDFVIAKFLGCDICEIYEKVQDAMTRAAITNYLNGQRLITKYRNKGGFYKEFLFRDLTITAASETYAYNGFLNMNVEQHLYAAHKIKLHRPYNPCVVELKGQQMQHRNYFPLETVRLLASPENTLTLNKNRRYIPSFSSHHFYHQNGLNSRRHGLFNHHHQRHKGNYYCFFPSKFYLL